MPVLCAGPLMYVWVCADVGPDPLDGTGPLCGPRGLCMGPTLPRPTEWDAQPL